MLNEGLERTREEDHHRTRCADENIKTVKKYEYKENLIHSIPRFRNKY